MSGKFCTGAPCVCLKEGQGRGGTRPWPAHPPPPPHTLCPSPGAVCPLEFVTRGHVRRHVSLIASWDGSKGGVQPRMDAAQVLV